MKIFPQIPVAIALSLLAVSCSTTRTSSNVVRSNSAQTITMEEYNQFAQEILGVITPRVNQYKNDSSRMRRGPVVLAIGDFEDKTSQYSDNFKIDKDVMYGQIRQVIVNSGLASVSMDMAGSGGDTDSLLKSINSLRASGEYDQSMVPGPGRREVPELILWGDIISITFEDGRNKNYQYALNVRLLDVATGGSIFEQQVQLDKQFYKGWFGK